ncbi:Sucrase/ferredoxin-like-domain-containing protein [Powellomyces hirtus]|nr:Sucrase/ferredoxin-like-domain-containing protein [Powellomyces hirtus]
MFLRRAAFISSGLVPIAGRRILAPPYAFVLARGISDTPAAFGKKKENKSEEGSDLPDHVASTGFYKKHVLISTGTSHWAKKYEDADAYYAQLQETLKAADIKVTASDAVPAGSAAGSDTRSLLVLPDNIQFPSVSTSDFAVLSQQLTSTAAHSAIKSHVDRHRIHVLVCVHGERDCRCGDRGRPLYEALKQEVKNRGLEARVNVLGVSHIGGHKHAGNAIVYPSGDWYGLLEAKDAKTFINAVTNNDVIWDKWRGRMGLSKDEQKNLYRQSTPTTGSAHLPAGTASTIEMTFILPNNTAQSFPVPLGETLMTVGRDNELPNIEGTCGGNLECATCHVVVDPKFADKLPPISEEEEDMLEYAIGRTQGSRLSCQIKATPELNGLRVMIPTVVPRKFPSMSDFRMAWQAQPAMRMQQQQQRAFSAATSSRLAVELPNPSSSSSSDSDPPPPPPPPKRDFKSLTREYGPIALGVYLSLSFMTFCLCLTCITVLNIDEAQIKAIFAYIKSMLGFTPADPAPPAVPTQAAPAWVAWMPEWMRSPQTRQILTSVLLAMGMTKLFLPIKLAITAAITPMVARKLRSFGFQLGQKGGYKNAAAQVKSEVKGRAHTVRERARERVEHMRRDD